MEELPQSSAVRAANDVVARALVSVAKAETQVERWNELIMSNLTNSEQLEFFVSERDKANERLDKANERLKDACAEVCRAHYAYVSPSIFLICFVAS